jgi:hypothetical protein
MDADELRLLPARQVLGWGAIGAVTLLFATVSAGVPMALPLMATAIAMLVLSFTIEPQRKRILRIASLASATAVVIWLLVPLVAPPGSGAAMTVIALGAAAASAWGADWLDREWRPRHSVAAAAPRPEDTAQVEIQELDPDWKNPISTGRADR